MAYERHRRVQEELNAICESKRNKNQWSSSSWPNEQQGTIGANSKQYGVNNALATDPMVQLGSTKSTTLNEKPQGIQTGESLDEWGDFQAVLTPSSRFVATSRAPPSAWDSGAGSRQAAPNSDRSTTSATTQTPTSTQAAREAAGGGGATITTGPQTEAATTKATTPPTTTATASATTTMSTTTAASSKAVTQTLVAGAPVPTTTMNAEWSIDGIWEMTLNRPMLQEFNATQIDCGELVEKAIGQTNISCTPEPDAFNPCEDIMGYPVLRVAVWFVVAASVFGNMSVIVVHLGLFRRLSVPKFLQLNLAIGDLFMGVYLAMLAVADLTTVGSYFNYAIDWQHGLGCSLAGAASLFASQLSIFTLTVITFERYYTITYSIDLNMRLQLGWAARIMLIGWLYAFASAMLPIFADINSYSKTSICLPMRTTYEIDRVFLFTLLIIDSMAFLIIFISYLKMYLMIRKQKTEAARKERTVAVRMALLVCTDFACWAPIIFFGATAVLGRPLISVTNSKILIVFFYPLNSMANPFLYVLPTRQYRRDLNYLAGKWQQWRSNLFKKQEDKVSFSYNNHLNQAYGLSQYPVGAQLNAHLGAVAAVTGVADHLRHYKLPINAETGEELGRIRSSMKSSLEREDQKSDDRQHDAVAAVKHHQLRRQQHQQQYQEQMQVNSLHRKQVNKSANGPNHNQTSSTRPINGHTHNGGQYIIRHTILSDKYVSDDDRVLGSTNRVNRYRVHRALKQRARLKPKNGPDKMVQEPLEEQMVSGRRTGQTEVSNASSLEASQLSKNSPNGRVKDCELGKVEVSEQKYVITINACDPKVRRKIAVAKKSTRPLGCCRCCCCCQCQRLQNTQEQCLATGCSTNRNQRILKTIKALSELQEHRGGKSLESSCEPASCKPKQLRRQHSPILRRCSSSGPPISSFSQSTNSKVTAAASTTEINTPEQTTSTGCSTTNGEPQYAGTIPRIITTNNGDEQQTCDCSSSAGLKNGRLRRERRDYDNCSRKQSSNSLEVCTRSRHRRKDCPRAGSRERKDTKRPLESLKSGKKSEKDPEECSSPHSVSANGMEQSVGSEID